jgi:PAS domain S-box-containing protein
MISPNTSPSNNPDYRTILENRLVSTLMDSVMDGFILLDSDWSVLGISPRAAQHLGQNGEEVTGRLIREICPDLGEGIFERECLRAVNEQQLVIFECFISSPNLWFEIHACPVQGGVFISLLNINDRRQVEVRLRDNQERMAGIISSAMDAIVTVDSAQIITLFNASAEKMFGTPASKAIGQPIERFIPDRFRQAHHHHIEKFGATRTTRRTMGSLGAVFGLRANGEEFPIEASVSQLESGGQKLYTVILRDITERKRFEAQLIEQAAMLNLAQDAILVRDLTDRVLFWNKSAERIYGWSGEEVTGQNIQPLIYRTGAEEFEKAKQEVLEKGVWAGELLQNARDGRRLVVDCNWTLVRDEAGHPKAILDINTDITERKKLEAQFLRAQRLESIGTLAGGIAHDLNNVLSPILMGVQMLQVKITDEQSRRMLELMRSNAERGAEMVKQVLSFARGVEGERVALQIRHLIKEVVKILAETLPKFIQINYRIAEDLWVLSGDATQLHQVLMNLCINARDAMPEGGALIIEAENKEIDQTYSQMIIEARPGRYVLLTVSDTGHGIPADQLNRIFDPFFTTKEIGKGTGLGLSTVLGIVKGHGGFVNVYSEIGKGTQFKVHLPALEISQLRQTEIDKPVLPAGNGELILVVDDEVAIREITRTTLESFNYRVLTASDGADAIAIFVQHRDSIKVVLTDMMMPYLDGPALIRALHRLEPQLKVIASSGLTDNGKTSEVASLDVKAFLAKPYTADRLLQTLADVLKLK